MSFVSFTTLSDKQIFEKLKTDAAGLSALEARVRLGKVGRNELERDQLRWQKVLARQFASPFLYLLIGAALLAFILGEYIDVAMIAIFILVNTSLGFYQEYQSEKAVDLLRKIVVANVRVRRDGEVAVIDSRDLVPGDIVLLECGDQLRADVRFISANGLLLNETILTGESEPVSKSAGPLSSQSYDLFRARNIGFSGTSVVSGCAEAVVIGTARETQIGEITHLTAETNSTSSFEKGIRRFSQFILWTILITLGIVFVANMIVKGGRVDLPALVLFSIALAVSVIPEALPVVTTMTLSRGALRLAKHNVVTKRLSAVEDLGSIEVLCTDKTGTLTEGMMNVADVYGKKPEVLEVAGLGAMQFGDGEKKPANPFDVAVWDALSVAERKRIGRAKRMHEIPFDPSKRWNGLVAEYGHGRQLIVRGAPEELVKLSHLSVKEIAAIMAWTDKQGRLGRRVLAIAHRKVDGSQVYVPEDGHLTFVGILALTDPIKKTAKKAIAQSKKLGVQVKILTGDSPAVAGAVACDVGLVSSAHKVLTGAQWTAMTANERQAAVRTCNVFARLSPSEKFEIIKTLQEKFEVGFLGEGINDAPALKIANVGIVVDGASDIARESADVILLKHDLQVIVEGIREGREVFANTVKYIKATLASNFGNFLAVATATLLVDYLPMLPVQILLVNLLSDFPMILIATDTVDQEELQRPRGYDVTKIVFVAAVIGVVSTIFDFIFFALFYQLDPSVLQTNWFIGSILTELVLIFSIRTRKLFFRATFASKGLALLSLAAFGATLIIPFTAWGQQIFQFQAPSVEHLKLILVVVVAYFIMTESVKLLFYRFVEKETA